VQTSVERPGKPLCLVCSIPVAKGRRSYCSHDCWVRNTPGMIRLAVLARDNGICAACGVQCRTRQLRRIGYAAWTAAPEWQADHIVPVAEGGGLCGLEGYRTLCVPCHNLASADLAKRMAAKRRQSSTGARCSELTDFPLATRGRGR